MARHRTPHQGDYSIPQYQPDTAGVERRAAHLLEVEAQLATLPALQARLAAQEFAAVDQQREPNEEELREVARVTDLVARVA